MFKVYLILHQKEEKLLMSLKVEKGALPPKGALLRAIVYTYTCWDQKVHIGHLSLEKVL